MIKKSLMVTIIVIVMIMTVSSCSNPQKKMVGRWIINPDSKIPDLPIEITEDNSVIIMENAMDLEITEVKDGIVYGNISAPGGLSVTLQYDSKNDIVIIEAMQNQSTYVRFTGTDDEWTAQNEHALIMQKEALVRINIYALEMTFKQYKEDKGKFPKKYEDIKDMLPPNIVNPFDYQKQAVYYGNEDAQYNAERLGAVYIKFDKKGENLDIVGYGIDQLIRLDDDSFNM